ncbi:ABC transporter ATP-binding protein [Phytohabitans suffuscus]|uniref:ABC-type quaternary amine transporter n=1 Tax=Phytohabitans suffuscus TaxID=624315 RepID=A0A6F8YB17_9ACTN|nr:ABC transporter ATP-binding protein [Phytohabitans suffuscus]BCB83151.1 ABC transporter [Phytohabitans suffuscus]
MSRLEIHGLVKRYGTVLALSGVDLTVEPGTLTAVLGPSGCGKTTLLRCVAGFERADGGRIRVDGRELAGPRRHTSPQRRGITVVPQEGALFPHLSVKDNVGYGLRRSKRQARVAETLELVGLGGYGDRMPHELSGGQRQRVAVARALAPQPALILLDEPFSALDAALRSDLRTDIQAALQAAGATAILVTHDQSEALSLADQVAVIRDGHIVQNGPPATVYHQPADPWVANFVGEAVLLPAAIADGRAATILGALPLTEAVDDATGLVLLRPEQIRLSPAGQAAVHATIEDRHFYGHDAVVGLRLDDGTRVIARVPGTEPVILGATVAVHVDGSAHTWPKPPPAGTS